MSFSIHVDLAVALHMLVRDVIDAGGTAGNVVIKSVGGSVLATIPLAYPCGSVNSSTGRLTIAGSVDPNPVGGGNAASGEIQDSTGKALITLPAVAGSAAVDNCIVLNSLTVSAGVPLELISCTIG